MQEGTIQESLLLALKSGIELPIHRLEQDFKFEGGARPTLQSRLTELFFCTKTVFLAKSYTWLSGGSFFTILFAMILLVCTCPE
jgi:hypothetical protein